MRFWLTSIGSAITITLIFAVAVLFLMGWLRGVSTHTAERPCVPSDVAEKMQKIPDASIPAAAHAIVEQYKAYVTDLGAVGAQFGSVQTFYLSVVSGLLALLAFKEKGRSAQELL